MSTPFETHAREFLAQQRLAVAGVSREGGAHTGNAILKALRDKGYTVFPVNPHTDEIEGETCYRQIADIPHGVDGVVIITRPEAALEIVSDAADAGVKYVWMHFNPLFGASTSSVSEEAVAFCQDHQMTVIAGACPLMFLDIPHKCMRVMLGWMGKLPH